MSTGYGHGARLAALADLTPGVPFGLQLEDGRRLCLVRDGATVHAVEDRCPHRDFALSGGDLIAPCVLECPWHGAQFDVRTGAVLQGPATDPITSYAVRVIDGTVYLA